ncbi:hypothetical protein DVT68_19210 [Dyella solisilvae]|uniref:DUF7716 domain-containing protein n=1 Tax=Dyella solisilvae TaxID=1920168 RepID=A0A370K311_9GAMM|nr:hypothetical protein [Dyella solisilvae]RDI97019.1 hypothetical protein DVT68_19210 [Dyella solisilvae]
MSELITLREAIDAIRDAFDEGDGWDRYAWVYIRGEITEPGCRLYLSHVADEDDALIDDRGEAMPPFAARHHLQHFLEASDFAEVLFVQRKRAPASSVDDYARALEHYRRHDAFLGMSPDSSP